MGRVVVGEMPSDADKGAKRREREDLHTMVLSALCSLLSAFCCVPIANTHANVALFLSLLSLLSLREGTQRPRVYDDDPGRQLPHPHQLPHHRRGGDLRNVRVAIIVYPLYTPLYTFIHLYTPL